MAKIPLWAQSEDGLQQYFDSIAAGSTPLSRGDEVRLAARIQDGDIQARNELVEANLRFVIDVAKNYQNRGLSLMDLIGAGNFGLMTAADRFDGTRGFKFISYAVWWIKQTILQAIAEHSRTVRLPMNRIDLIRKIARVRHKFAESSGGDVSEDAIAKKLGVSVKEIHATIIDGRSVRSLDEPFSDGDERSLANLLPNEGPAPDEDVLDEELGSDIAKAIQSLDDEREEEILRLYFGLDGEEPIMLEQIGEIMNLTRERIRQLKERALDRLRHPKRAIPLRVHVDPDAV